jgi:hypothetical protein
VGYLREEVRHEFLMVGDWVTLKVSWALGFAESNELTGDDASLVKKLVEAVLSYMYLIKYYYLLKIFNY